MRSRAFCRLDRALADRLKPVVHGSAPVVVYNADGTVLRDRFLGRSPDPVLADTDIIAQAPARILVAEIGDALATC